MTAQKFVDINPFALHQKGVIVSPQFGDINGDGWLDVLANQKVYINTKDGKFAEYAVSALSSVLYYNGYINNSLGDYDNDGLLDILVSYQLNDNKNYTKIFKNMGRDSSGFWLFYDIGANITGVVNNGFAKSLQWGDYDNDGDLDILILGNTIGTTKSTPYADIYRNDKGVFTPINAGFEQFRDGTASFIDYDSDGDLDVMLTGNTTEQLATSAYTRLYQNTNGKFVDSKISFLDLVESTITWGDYDQDGKPDVFITGRTFPSSSGLYHNDGNGKFTLTTNQFDSRYWGDVSWGDFDNDGDLDLFISGEPLNSPAKYYRNDNGNFTLADSIATGRMAISSPGDFDNDGNLDLLYASFFPLPMNVVFTIYKNSVAKANTAPSFPLNLKSNVNGKNVTLSWDKAIDNETKANGLTYNIYVGDSYNRVSIVTPNSVISNGKRMLAEFGNCQQNISKLLKGLPDGVYYWSVQAIDNNFEGSTFAPEQTFTIGNIQAIDTLKIVQPNGGEVYSVNDPINIKWDGLWAKDTILLEFTSDNGTSWQTLTDKGINKSFNWTAPDIQSTKCLVKASSFEKMNPKVIQRFDGLASNVTDIKYSNDGKRLLSFSRDSNFRLWDIKTGTEKAKFRNYTPPTNSWVGHLFTYANFSEDDSMILTVEQYIPNCFVTVWNSDASKKLHELKISNDQYPIYAAISPNNKYLAVAHSIDIEIYDLNSPNFDIPIKIIKFSSLAYSRDIDFSHDSKYLAATVMSDSSFVLIETSTWNIIYKDKFFDFIYTLDFNHSSSKILLTDAFRRLIIWDIATHKTESIVNLPYSIGDATYAKDDSKIFYYTNEFIASKYVGGIFDVKSKRILCNLDDNKQIVGGMFAPDMNYAVTTDSVIKIWQLNPIAAFSDVSNSSWTIMKNSGSAFIELSIDTIVGKVNDVIEVPIRLKSSSNLTGSGITKIQTTLTFNGNVLYPTNNTSLGILNAETREIQIDLPINPIANNTLSKLNFEILLGNSESTNILFKNSQAIGGTALISENSGLVTISNICKDGGTRLVKSGNTFFEISISPNPANDYLEVSFSGENNQKNRSIVIYNSLCEKIDEYNCNENNKKIDLYKYPNGMYYLNVNNEAEYKSFIILK